MPKKRAFFNNPAKFVFFAVLEFFWYFFQKKGLGAVLWFKKLKLPNVSC
jgi:hypothetical protein